MCRINSQLKKLIHLKYLILETPTPFSLCSVGILVLHTCFRVLTTTTFPFFGLKDVEKML